MLSHLTLITGLPGSGKTTLAQSLANAQTWYIPLDQFPVHNKLSEKVRETIKRKEINHIVLEGLISNNGFYQILDLFKSFPQMSVDIISFKNDIATCLWNDAVRHRDQNATITIQHAQLVLPRLKSFEARYPNWTFTMTKKNVVKAPVPEAIAWAQSNGIELEKKMREYHYNSDGPALYINSDSWCLGGTSGNCYDSETSEVNADVEPASFNELDKLLERICPQLGFLQYKGIMRDCVETVSWYSSDYYGGCVGYAAYSCDIMKLHRKLQEYKLI